MFYIRSCTGNLDGGGNFLLEKLQEEGNRKQEATQASQEEATEDAATNCKILITDTVIVCTIRKDY